MAGIGNTYFDIIDLLTRTDNPESMKAAVIIELLKQYNPMLDDAIALPCNQGVSHKTTVRTGLPQPTWGMLYQGVQPSKSTTVPVTDTTGFCESLAPIDERLLELSPNENETRLSEAEAHLEGLSQDVASTMIYGNSSLEPEKFTGLSPRFSSLSAANGGQIVDAGGTGSDNQSVWFVVWGERTCHTLYPRGATAGINRMDKGSQRVLDDNGNPYYVKEELFRQHIGLSVRDWRYVVRVANIDSSELLAGNVDVLKILRQGMWRLKSHQLGDKMRGAIYATDDFLEAVDADTTPTTSTSSSYVRLRPDEAQGKEIMQYRTFPMRQVDALLKTEARVV